MAYRRSISTRAKLLLRQRFSPSVAYIHQDDNGRNEEKRSFSYLLQHRSFGSGTHTSSGFNSQFQHQRLSNLSVHPMAGSFCSRYMSTTVGDGADKFEYMTDVAEVLTDTTVEAVASAAPAVNEVAIAAADSAFPVAALQHLIDAVHSATGFNWWASIALTTLLIRGATIPLLINQLKSTTKLSLLRPRLEELKLEMQNKGMEPEAVAEGQRQMQALFKEYGVTPFTPLKGLLFQGPIFISFFLAINNMVEKVPSFKQGGASWFTDLTTPDSLYIFPALTALSFWITVECNMQEGMEGNPAAKTMKNVSRVFAALTVPVVASFPKALFCYWVTSNIFSLMYGLVLKAPGVKKFLGVPEIPITPDPPASKQPEFSFFESIKKYAAAQAALRTQQTTSPSVQSSKPEAYPEISSSSAEASKPASGKRISSSSVLNQRLRTLEKQVKGRKTSKKS